MGPAARRLDVRSRSQFRELPVGPSRHLVRFLVVNGRTYALKEEPLGVATAEFEVLRHLEAAGLPAVTAVGLAQAPDRDSAILMTEYLTYSIQYRRLLMRFPLGSRAVPGAPAGRDGLAPGGPPSIGRVLGRLLAREHPVPA